MFRERNMFIGIVIVSFILLWVITDPELNIVESIPFGAGLVSILTSISGALLGVVILHITRKGLMDYESADFNKRIISAQADPRASGLAAIAISLKTLAYAVVIAVGFISF